MIEFKEIPGYQGYYAFSDGTIIRYAQTKLGQKLVRSLTEKKLKGSLDKDGYVSISLFTKGKTKVFKLHRIIAQVFIPNPFNKETVNHINGIKTDNRVENLEWASYSENNLHSYRTGLKNPTDVSGSKNPRYKNGLYQRISEPTACMYCGNVFVKRLVKVKFCSLICRNKARVKKSNTINQCR